MGIFLDAHNSLQLLRAARMGADFALIPAPGVRLQRPDPPRVTLGTLEVPQLLDFLGVSEHAPLRILVPCGKDRIRSKGIACRTSSAPRGSVPFCELVAADPDYPSLVTPDSTRVFALGPEGIVLGMARILQQKVRKGQMSHQRAMLMLQKLCLELCGTYVHDPFEPHTGEVMYRRSPVLSTIQLEGYLSLPGNEAGLALAREVAPTLYDGSGSPQESMMGPALFGATKLGGLDLCDFVANEALDLDPSQRRAIDYRTITPDFWLAAYQSAIEYNGSVHDEGNNPHIDRIRMLDYQTLSIRAFVFTYDDVRTQQKFMHSAHRIVQMMSWTDGPNVLHRFERMWHDSEFARRQQVLFETYRPWLR